MLKRAAPKAPLVRHSQALLLPGVHPQVRPRDNLKYHRPLLVILLNTFLTSAVAYGGWQELAWQPPWGLGGDWHFNPAFHAGLFVIGDPVLDHNPIVQRIPEVSLFLKYGSFQAYLMVSTLCHVQARPMHKLDLAGQDEA